jgi:hypothetical protein
LNQVEWAATPSSRFNSRPDSAPDSAGPGRNSSMSALRLGVKFRPKFRWIYQQPPDAGKHQISANGQSKLKLCLRQSLEQEPANPCTRKLPQFLAPPSRPGTPARISSTPRSLWSLHPFPATLSLFESTPPPSPGMLTLPLWLSPRPVTHRHVTRARLTSPGTPWPFNSTRPSASLSALHSPIGSGHCPSARS